MVYLLKRFLCCIPLQTGVQIIIWISCLTRLLLVFTTVYLATFLLRTETNQMVTNMPSPSNNSFYYEIGYGIDRLLFFSKGTYIQRFVILTGLTAMLQVMACICGIYAIEKDRPSWLVPWLVMFSHASFTETGVSITNILLMFALGQDLQNLIPDAISALSHGVFLSYFIWVVYSYYKKEKRRKARPIPMAPLYPAFLGEATPPYNPAAVQGPAPAFKEPSKAATLPAGFDSHGEYKIDVT